MKLSREAVAELRHRLRTPLNHILGYSEMLLEDAGIDASSDFNGRLRAIHATAQELLLSLQHSLSPAGQHPTSADIDRFRADIAAPVRKIAETIGAALPIAPEESLADVLRIASAIAELLDFARGQTKEALHSTRLRPGVISGTVLENKASVLVIDDDEANRDILSRQLQRLGFTVATANDGPQGLARLPAETFDIVLVDFMMPDMDGLDVLEAIKQDPATRDIPVLMISALDELSGVTRCIERGADDYLFKPFDPVLLGARISAALERTRLRQRERERAKELELISQKLQRSNEDLKRFAYAASHDLQAPLRTITTHLQLLERHVGPQLSSDDSELIRFPVAAAMRMTQLIRDLLTYSQVSTEERFVSSVSSEEILARTLDDLASAIADSHAVITHDPLPKLVADAVQLRQLFLNLIGNAIKYRRDDPPRIHVGALREYAGWHFTVSDNGVGIPSEHIDDVFKLFKRLHGYERPGTGLGLAICKRIVERVGGRIWVESQAGSGSTFHFTIPDEQPSESPDSLAQQAGAL